MTRGYKIPCNSSARRIKLRWSDRHSWGLWKGLRWVVSRVREPLKDGLSYCLEINGTIKALGKLMRFFSWICRAAGQPMWRKSHLLRRKEKYIVKIKMFAFPKNILQTLREGNQLSTRLSCCRAEKSEAFSSSGCPPLSGGELISLSDGSHHGGIRCLWVFHVFNLTTHLWEEELQWGNRGKGPDF